MSSEEVVSMTVPAFSELWAVSHEPTLAPVTCQVPFGLNACVPMKPNAACVVLASDTHQPDVSMGERLTYSTQSHS